ncbi:MAG: hypothetical protein JO227_21830 [Acetobacteraceae bacterium]|nr:hypothetical protein [Acetobacteraceae bacterium]
MSLDKHSIDISDRTPAEALKETPANEAKKEETFDDPVPTAPGGRWTYVPVDLNEADREKTRRIIVKIVTVALVLQFPASLIAIGLGLSSDVVKDVLAISLGPLVALASVFGYSYFK